MRSGTGSFEIEILLESASNLEGLDCKRQWQLLEKMLTSRTRLTILLLKLKDCVVESSKVVPNEFYKLKHEQQQLARYFPMLKLIEDFRIETVGVNSYFA